MGGRSLQELRLPDPEEEEDSFWEPGDLRRGIRWVVQNLGVARAGAQYPCLLPHCIHSWLRKREKSRWRGMFLLPLTLGIKVGEDTWISGYQGEKELEESRAGSSEDWTRVSLRLEPGKGADLGWGAQTSSWWDAEYLGLGCETLGLASWMPGVWREAWAGGRQLGVGGWDRKWGPGRRGPGESQAGEGVIFSGNCSFSGEGAEDTHVPCHKLTHVCTHASCTCEQWMEETGARGP